MVAFMRAAPGTTVPANAHSNWSWRHYSRHRPPWIEEEKMIFLSDSDSVRRALLPSEKMIRTDYFILGILSVSDHFASFPGNVIELTYNRHEIPSATVGALKIR